MTHYLQQIHCAAKDIDLDFWRQPEGIEVPDDELSFLLIPDAVEAQAMAAVCREVHHYQRDASEPITCALMATMGGMLPGILAYDHLVQGRPDNTPRIQFGSIGVSLYKGPNERYDEPLVQQDVSIDIAGQNVLVIDDLGDRGGTLQFLQQHLSDQGASEVMSLVLYMKPEALQRCPADFYFGEVAQDTWIITPREYVETLMKRVPVWRERGANQAECQRRLVELIGYPASLADYYLERLFNTTQ